MTFTRTPETIALNAKLEIKALKGLYFNTHKGICRFSRGHALFIPGKGFVKFKHDTTAIPYTPCGGKDKVTLAPIFNWTDTDVWDFIREHNLPYCDLYDKGFHRIGCMFCPMSQPATKRREMQMFPLVAERVYIKAIRELMAMGKYDRFDSAEQVFKWWISGESVNDWFAMQARNNNQPNLFDDGKTPESNS